MQDERARAGQGRVEEGRQEAAAAAMTASIVVSCRVAKAPRVVATGRDAMRTDQPTDGGRMVGAWAGARAGGRGRGE
jgi:hypothetical protein